MYLHMHCTNCAMLCYNFKIESHIAARIKGICTIARHIGMADHTQRQRNVFCSVINTNSKRFTN